MKHTGKRRTVPCVMTAKRSVFNKKTASMHRRVHWSWLRSPCTCAEHE